MGPTGVGEYAAVDLLRAFPCAAVILDAAGRFVEANREWTRFCVEHDGFAVALRPGDDYVALCVDGIDAIAVGLRTVIDGSCPQFAFEYPCRSADGDRWIRIVVTPLGGGALVTHTDFGDDYNHLAPSLTGDIEATIELGHDLRPFFVGAAWRKFAGRGSWTAPLGAESADVLHARLTECLLDHEPFTLELEGVQRWYRVSANPDVDVAGSVRRVVLLLADITEERRAVVREAAQDERFRLAAELHDTVVQQLYATALVLQRRVGEERSDPGVLHDTIARLDRVIADLRAVGRIDRPVSDVGDALHGVLTDAAGALGFEPRADIQVALEQIEPRVAVHLIAVLNESLSNVARHAGATACEVQLVARSGGLVLVIADNGRGMPAALSRSSGTRNISHRAEELGGRAMWSPGATGGTVVTWQVPLTGDLAAAAAADGDDDAAVVL